MLFVVKERLEGLRKTLILWGGGGGTQGEGIGMSTVQKGAILLKCLNTFVPHCSFRTTGFRNARHLHRYSDNNQ